jgi:regulator of sigma D
VGWLASLFAYKKNSKGMEKTQTIKGNVAKALNFTEQVAAQVGADEQLDELLHIRMRVAQAFPELSAYEATKIAAQLIHTRTIDEALSGIAEKLDDLYESINVE